MQVSELMTRSPHGMQAGGSVQHAAQLMAKHNIGAVLVYEGSQLAGIVTDRDLPVRFTANGAAPESEPVRAVMTAHPVTVLPQRVLTTPWGCKTRCVEIEARR